MLLNVRIGWLRLFGLEGTRSGKPTSRDTGRTRDTGGFSLKCTLTKFDMGSGAKGIPRYPRSLRIPACSFVQARWVWLLLRVPIFGCLNRKENQKDNPFKPQRTTHPGGAVCFFLKGPQTFTLAAGTSISLIVSTLGLNNS